MTDFARDNLLPTFSSRAEMEPRFGGLTKLRARARSGSFGMFIISNIANVFKNFGYISIFNLNSLSELKHFNFQNKILGLGYCSSQL
jgi:hypothetical protein